MQNTYQVSAEELMEQISIIIQDEFVAKFQMEKNSLQISLGNGQRFCVVVEEIK